MTSFVAMEIEKDLVLKQLIGKRITQLRKEAGYSSQETFSYDAEIPRALYGKYEKGANITMTSLYRIVKFHKISFERFFSEGFEALNDSDSSFLK